MSEPQEFEIEWLFSAIDGNQNGVVTYNEFESYFVDDPSIIVKRDKKKFCLTPQMEKEISDLFRMVDVNDDKSISIDELNLLF